MKNTLRAGEILRSITAGAAFVIFAVMLSIKAYGADFNASVSSGEATQGENVTVTVNMSSDVTVGAYDLTLTYDANILEYVSGADGGGGGSLRLYNDSNYAGSYTVTVTFKAIGAGSTKLSVVKQGDICDIDLNDLTLKASDGTVMVKAPSTSSSNANLSSLKLMAVKADGWSGSVNLMPDFSKDVTSYQLWLGSEFSKLSVSAVAEDGKAKISTSGTELTAGQDNTATVTVTAEDGTVKTYTIIVHVKAKPAEDTTTAAENNNTDTPADVTTAPEDNPQDTTTGNENPSGADDRNVTISEKPYTVEDVPEDMELPEGFERKAVSWNGIEVMGASDQSGTLTLLYLKNNESSESRLYIYNSEKSSYTPFMSYTITQRSYVMLMADDDLMFEGEKAAESRKLELTTLNIADGYVDAYKLKNAENIYIVKAMNWDNKIGYYYYSSTDGSMIPYYETAVKSQDNNAAQPVTNSAKESNITELLFWIVVGLSVILMLIIVVLAVNLRRLSASDTEDSEDDEDDETDEFDEDDEFNDMDERESDDGFEGEVSCDVKEADLDDKTDETQELMTEEPAEETEAQKPEKEEKYIVAENPTEAAIQEITEQTAAAQETVAAQETAAAQETQATQETAVQEAATAQKAAVQEATTTQEAPAQETATAQKTPPQEITAGEPEENQEKRDTEEKPKKEKKEKKEKNKISKKEAAAKEDISNNNTESQKEENMSEQELDNAIDDILGQLFK
ncbi:MAG: hypothetical protein K1W00_04145 [Lachnospiraceae bacterium]